MASLLDRVYARSPVFVQNAMATGYGIQQRVRRTVEFAATCVPYYRELFARERIKPTHIRGAADLAILPMLDKATVQAEGERLRPDRRRVPGILHTTGGTTGSPV